MIKSVVAKLVERKLSYDAVFTIEFNNKLYKVEAVIEITTYGEKKDTNVDIKYIPEDLLPIEEEVINEIRGDKRRTSEVVYSTN